MDAKQKNAVNAALLAATGLVALGAIFWVARMFTGSEKETTAPKPEVEVVAVPGGGPVEVPPVDVAAGTTGAGDAGGVMTPGAGVQVRTPEGNVIVYSNALVTAPGEEWSENNIATVPADKNRKYLGQFKTEPVTLSLGNLPAHKMLKINFDLLTTQSWDGSSVTYGASIWDLNIAKGANLIHTTIGNCGFFSDNNEQAFPDTWPCGPHPAWTGSSEHQTLGVMQDWGGPARTFDCSSVYKLALVFPHTDSKVTFRFKGSPQRDMNKPWGLANVQVEAIVKVPEVTQEQLAAMWAALGSSEPMTAYKAHWDLVAAGDPEVSYIGQHLNEMIVAPTQGDLETLKKDLYSGDDAKVAGAVAGLREKGKDALPILQAAADDPDLPAKVKRLVRPALAALTPNRRGVEESIADLRLHRARHLLQVIHSEDALALVEKIQPHPGDDGKYQSPMGSKVPGG